MADSKPIKFFIFAGETSGDLHGAPLIRALKNQFPHAVFHGVGGPHMRSEGLACVEKMESFQVMGFSDVFKALPKLVKHFYRLRDYILAEKPDAAIFIDYPGFNLRLEKALKKKGFQGKIIHYICPSVWAWGKGRIPQMAQTLDLLLTIYPFEATYFSNTSLPVKYVGNPLVEKIARYEYNDEWKKVLGIPETKSLIAVFAGSREGEIVRNFPIQLKAMAELKKIFPELIFAISCAQSIPIETLKELISKSSLTINQDLFIVPSHFNYELMRDSHTAIAKSGTVTLELALHQRPTVVVYKLSNLNRFVAKYLLRLKLPFYCIVNILAQKEVFPELIADEVTVEGLKREFTSLYQSDIKRDDCLKHCQEVIQQLQNTDINDNASKQIAEILKQTRIL